MVKELDPGWRKKKVPTGAKTKQAKKLGFWVRELELFVLMYCIEKTSSDPKKEGFPPHAAHK